MIRKAALVLAVLAAVLIAPSFSAVADDQRRIRFTFSPQPNTSFVQHLKTTKTKDFGELGVHVDETVSRTAVTLLRTDSGWDVVAEPKEVEFKRNGEIVHSPIMEEVTKAKVTYCLDPAGKLVDVLGYEALVHALSQQLPPEVLKQLAPLMSVQALKDKATTDWNGRFGEFLGAEVRLGDTLVGRVPFQLPNGAVIEYTVRTTISVAEPCGGTICVRIDQTYGSDAAEAAKLIVGTANGIASSAPPGSPSLTLTPEGGAISGRVLRLIDPSTMLIYREELDRRIEMLIEVAGRGKVPMTMTESRSYDFTY